MAFPTGWQYRCPIVIDADQVDDALADWPLLLTEANLPPEIFTDANADGSDIRASSDEAGTAELAVEVVSFDAGGTAEIWVQVPSVSAVADTTIYLWFGNSSATLPAADSAFGSQAVWSNDFAAVWHLEESGDGTAGEYRDSTANANHGQGGGGTGSAVPTRVAGVTGYAQQFDGGDYIDCGGVVHDADNDQIAVTAWVQFSSLATEMAIAGEYGNPDFASGWLFALQGNVANDPLRLLLPGVISHYSGVSGLAAGTWYLLAVTYDKQHVRFFKNGEQISAHAQTAAVVPATRNLFLGAFNIAGTASSKLSGLLDSSRISSVARSPAWIAADYASQSAPGTFAAAGTVADLSSSTPAFVPWLIQPSRIIGGGIA